MQAATYLNPKHLGWCHCCCSQVSNKYGSFVPTPEVDKSKNLCQAASLNKDELLCERPTALGAAS